jgi:hypothetical protein
MDPSFLRWFYHSQTQLHLDAPPGMKVYAAKLLIFLNLIGIHLFWLEVQLIALHQTVTARFFTEAKHGPKIRGELSKSVRGKLVKLHPKLQQNIS